MKDQISAIELKYIVNELKYLENSKVSKIYQPTKKSLLLDIHTTGKGRTMLKINEKQAYITISKPQMQQPPSFCKLLRKKLTNSRINKIFQYNSERILVIEFNVFKNNEHNIFKLIAEFFGKNNILFCDENNMIISPIQLQKFKDRVLRGKQQYEFPKTQDIFNLKKTEFEKIIKTDQILGKTLATKMGLGKLYSDELCEISKIDKKINGKNLVSKDIDKLFKNFNDLLNKKTKACIYNINQDKEITPFPLKILENHEKQEFETFNQAIDNAFIEQKTLKTPSKYDSEINKLKKAINMQQTGLKKLEKEIIINQKIGETIYNNYNELNNLFESIKEMTNSLSWKEIKEKLKNHKIIKNIYEKNGEIEIEI